MRRSAEATESAVARSSPLARILFLVYVLLVGYASLYPFADWRGFGLSPFAYVLAPWARYVTAFDVTVNVAGYVPVGFLAMAALHPRLRGVPAFCVAVLGAAALSLLLEAAQGYLPARIPSNLDVLCNIGGAALGAALGQHFATLISEGFLHERRMATFLPGADIDFGLVLVALWLFVQLNPVTLLFGAGDLRDLLAPHEGRARTPEFFVAVEATTTAANLVAVGLLLSTLTAAEVRVRRLLGALVLAALIIKTAAFAIVVRTQDVFAWLTHGAQIGLAVGIALAFLAVALPRTARLALAAVLLMAGTVLVNLAPPNPYFADSLKVWQQGHFLNFNGLTRLVSALWPFVALGYLIYSAARRRDAVG